MVPLAVRHNVDSAVGAKRQVRPCGRRESTRRGCPAPHTVPPGLPAPHRPHVALPTALPVPAPALLQAAERAQRELLDAVARSSSKQRPRVEQGVREAESTLGKARGTLLEYSMLEQATQLLQEATNAVHAGGRSAFTTAAAKLAELKCAAVGMGGAAGVGMGAWVAWVAGQGLPCGHPRPVCEICSLSMHPSLPRAAELPAPCLGRVLTPACCRPPLPPPPPPPARCWTRA